MPPRKVAQLRINYRAFLLQRRLFADITHALCRPLTTQPETIFAWNKIGLLYRIGHVAHHTALQPLAHLFVIAHLWHDDIAPDAFQFVEINHLIGHALVLLADYNTNPITNLNVAQHTTVAIGINDFIRHRITPIERQKHDGGVVTAFTCKSIDSAVAFHLHFFIRSFLLTCGCFCLFTTRRQQQNDAQNDCICLRFHKILNFVQI